VLRLPNRITSKLTLIVVPLTALLALGSVPAAVAPAPAAPAERASRAPDTVLTVRVAGCEGCVLTAHSNDGVQVPYTSLAQTVVDSVATFTVPSERTPGLSLAVNSTPWQGNPSQTTYVVFRYGGMDIGERVGVKLARSKRRGSGCWAGTVNDAVEVKVRVKKARVPSLSGGKTAGAIAWAPLTEPYREPMAKVRRGVLRSSGVYSCASAPLGPQTYRAG